MVKFLAHLVYTIQRGLMWLGYRMKTVYMDPEHKSRRFEGPVIFVGNHTSHKDGVMSSVYFYPSRAHILVAKDWYERKNINWYLRYNRTIPTDREGTDTTWLRQAQEVLKNKGTVIMYPEGKTNHTEPVPDEFKPGFIMLALMSGARIVPFATTRPYHFLFGPRQRIVLGKPMELSAEGKGLKPEYMKAEAARFRDIIISMMQKGEVKA